MSMFTLTPPITTLQTFPNVYEMTPPVIFEGPYESLHPQQDYCPKIKAEIETKIIMFFVSLPGREMIDTFPLERVLRVINAIPDQQNHIQKEAILKAHDSIRKASLKSDGYCQRLFSKETWHQWFEHRTALGIFVSNYVNFMKFSSKISIDAKMVREAVFEAQILLELWESCVIQYWIEDIAKHDIRSYTPRN